MFLFIAKQQQRKMETANLNTSHVLIYPLNSVFTRSCDAHLNTSHVLIYPKASLKLQFSILNLNTSHVLIYPLLSCAICIITTFKYISCSYLSGALEFSGLAFAI